MRDRRFVAEHRGGPLKKEQHYLLLEWGCLCAEHVLHLFKDTLDPRLLHAIEVGRAWTKGEATVGDARKASVACIAVANEVTDPTSILVARAVGHAVATAHMADHALGPAWYALKAVKSAGLSQEEERSWQDEQLVDEIKALVLSGRILKNI